VPDGAVEIVQSLFPGLALAALGIAFGLALFRSRLWDVDLVVRRSLVFGGLWLAIVAMYAAIAGGLGLVAGGAFPLEIAIGITILATLLFQPARQWLEGAASRLAFGQRESPVVAIRSLGEIAGETTQPGEIGDALVAVASRSVRVGWIEARLRGAPPVTLGTRTAHEITSLPVAVRDERYGELDVQAERGAALDFEDVDILRALASQAALALSNASLASRIVRAQEGERRRIERNIHDGAQQDLAALNVRLGLARSRFMDDAAVTSLLDEVQRDVRKILVDLRDLAQGIHPSVLRDGGLVAAIQDRCGRLPTTRVQWGPIELGTRRFAPEIEAAAYFFVAESVANALKHAAAPSIEVTITALDGTLELEVADAGRGADPADLAKGSGLGGLGDRIRALGGAMSLESALERGTRVRATLPARPAAEVGG
jgi:signal transduction histidine kinase